MSITSGYTIEINWSGDIDFSETFESPNVSTGSGQIQQVALASGANTITVPTSAVAVTILMPSGNTVQVTLKGVSGDTGIALNQSGPSLIGLQGVTSFVLNAASVVTVRLIYS